MTEADLITFIEEARRNHPGMGPGNLFNWILHNLPEKLPQKRIRVCMGRLAIDKLRNPEPPPPSKVKYEEPRPEEPRRELYQMVVEGLRPERPETPEELREMFDPRD